MMESVEFGLSHADAEEWDNAEVTKRQSDLRHALSLIYGDHESQTDIDNNDSEDIRATVTYSDDEIDQEGENLRPESSESSSFSLSDIEVESVEDGENEAMKEPVREFYNIPRKYENNIVSNLNISYANSTLSNPSYVTGADAFTPDFVTKETRHTKRYESFVNQTSPSVSQNYSGPLVNNIVSASKPENKLLYQRNKHKDIKNDINSQHTTQLPNQHRGSPLCSTSKNNARNQPSIRKSDDSNHNVDVGKHETLSDCKYKGHMLSPSQGEQKLKEDRIESLESQLKNIMKEKHNLQEQIGLQRTRLEEVELSREDVKDELALLKSLWEQAIEFQHLHKKDSLTNISTFLGSFATQNAHINFPKLEELRGSLLEESKKNLEDRTAECNRLKEELRQVKIMMESKESRWATENNKLKEQNQSLSPPKQKKMPPPSLTQTLNSLKEKARRKENEMKNKLENSEKNVISLTQQLEQLEESKKIMQKRAKNSKQELEKLKKELLNSPQEFQLWKSKAQSLQRERDGLREEVNELVRSRGGKPQKSIERKYQVELDNMRQVAEQIKAEADQRISEAHTLDVELKKKLELAQQEKLDAMKDIEVWKKGLHSFVNSVKNLENAGHLPIRCVNLLVAGLGSELADLLIDLFPNEVELPTLSAASSAFNELLKNRNDESNTREAKLLSSASQTNCDENTTSKINMVSVGSNTEFTFTSVHDFEEKSLQSKNNLIDLEKKVADIEMDNANLMGSNQHLKEQVDWYQKRLKESQSKTETLQSPPKLSSTAQVAQGLASPGSFVMEDFNQVQMANARHQQEVEILKESRQVVEDENKKILKQYMSLERIAEEATKECEQLSKHVDELNLKSNMLLEQRNTIQEQLKELSDENGKILNSKLAVDEKNESLSKTLSHLQGEYDKIVKMKIKDEFILKNLQEENDKLKASLLHTGEKLGTVQSEAQKLVDQNASSYQDLNNKYDALLKLNQVEVENNKAKNISLHKIGAEKASLQEECKTLKLSLDKFQNSIRTLEENRREAEVMLQNAEHEKEKLHRQNIELSDSITAMQSKLELLQSNNSVLSDLKNGFEEQHTSLQNKHTSMKSRIGAYEVEIHSLKEQLSSKSSEKNETKAFVKEMKIENKQLIEMNKQKEEHLMKLKNDALESRTKIDLLEKDLAKIKIELENSLKKESGAEKKINDLINQIDQMSISKHSIEQNLVGMKNHHTKLKKKLESCEAELQTKRNEVNALIKGKEKIEEILGSNRLETNTLLVSKTKLESDYDHMTRERDSLALKIELNKTIVAQLNQKIDALTKENVDMKDELSAMKAEVRLLDASRVSTEIDRFYLNDETSVVREDIVMLKNELMNIKDGYRELSDKKQKLQTVNEDSEESPTKRTPIPETQNHKINQNTSVASERSASSKSHCYIVTDDGDLRVKTTIYGTTPGSEMPNKLNPSKSLPKTPTFVVNGKDSVDRDTSIRPRQLQLSCYKKSKISDTQSDDYVFSIPLSSNKPKNISERKKIQRKSEAKSKINEETYSLDEKLSRIKLSARRAALFADTHINKPDPAVRTKPLSSRSESVEKSSKFSKLNDKKSMAHGNFEDIEETEAFVMQILNACGD